MIGRVADDDDIIIDDLQEQLAGQLDKQDEKSGIKVNSLSKFICSHVS